MRFLVTLTILVLAVSLGTYYLVQEPGYIFVQWGTWQIEMSLALIIGALIILSLIAYVLHSLVAGVMRMPLKVIEVYRKMKAQRSREQSVKGYIHLVQGDWDKAEKHLTTTANRADESIIDYLAAAYSAQQRGDIPRRDRLLERAGEGNIASRTVIDLVRSKLLIDEGRIEEAIETLKKVRRSIPNSRATLRLLVEAYVKSGSWSDIYDLLPSLRKIEAFATAEINELADQAYKNKFATTDTAAELLKIWKQVPAEGYHDPRIIESYVNRLLDFERYLEAEKVLRQALDSKWDSNLAYLYGCIGGSLDFNQIYKRAVEWLEAHADDADLLLTCGRLSVKNKEWTKARNYFSECIERGGRDEANVELANILEDQGDFQGAFEAYKQGASSLLAHVSVQRKNIV